MNGNSKHNSEFDHHRDFLFPDGDEKPNAGIRRPKVYIKTFGCQMNEADSEIIASSFKSVGFDLTHSPGSADALVLNTCTVRQHAEDKAVSLIGRLKKWKEENPKRKIIVAGCAVEKIGEKELIKKFPFVDACIGAKSINRFGEILAEIFGEIRSNEKRAADEIFNSSFSAYLTIMRGCSMNCTYCIVPRVRGEARHRPPEEIIEEARKKVSAGAKELVLLGQTVNSYRWAGKGEGADFTDLLKDLSGIRGLARIRFMSPHPLFFNDKFFEEFERNEKIASHIHLPAQSGSDRILRLMKRGYTREKYLEITSRIGKARKDASLSTDFIVGFPGETEEDFAETLELAEKGNFSFAFCFKYSPRTDSPKNGNTPPQDVLEKRLNRLLETVKANSKRIFSSRIGKIEKTLFEEPTYGRSSANFRIRTSGEAAPGEIRQVLIERVEKNILFGKVLK